MVLVVVVLMGIESTAFASTTYAGQFKYRIAETANSVSMENYVRDDNSFCKITGEPTYVNYRSTGLYLNDDDNYVDWGSTYINFSGGPITHRWYGDETRGKLRLGNSDYYGTLLSIAGNIE